MLGMGKDKGKSPIEYLNEAYKVGGMPLVLIVLGALCIFLPLGEAVAGTAIKVVNPGSSLIVGCIIVVSGAVAWVFATQRRTRLQIALLRLISEVTTLAATSPKDGANFKVAMEEFMGQLPNLFSKLTSVASEGPSPKGGVPPSA